MSKQKISRYVLRVDIRPRALPSARGKAGQRGYRPRPYQQWARRVEDELRRIWGGRPPVAGPVGVYLSMCGGGFTIWIDPYEGSVRGDLRGDADNYAKAVLDCLTKARVIGDDKQVECVHANFYRPEQEQV